MKTIKIFGATSVALEMLRMVLEVRFKFRVQLGEHDIVTEKPQRFSVGLGVLEYGRVIIEGSYSMFDGGNLRPVRARVTIVRREDGTVFATKLVLISPELSPGLEAKAEYGYAIKKAKSNPPSLVRMDNDERGSGVIRYGSLPHDIQVAKPEGFGSHLDQFTILKHTPRETCYLCSRRMPVMNLEQGKGILHCTDYGCRNRAQLP